MVDIAQLVEQRIVVPCAMGSIPISYPLWSLGVTDSTKHYECFREGSNPSETTKKSELCVPELGREKWRMKEGNGVPACLLNKNPLSWVWFESTVLRKKKQGSWGVRSPRFVWDEENSQVRILPTLLKIVMCPSGLGTILI